MKKLLSIFLLLGIQVASAESTFKVIPTYGIMTLKSDYENFNAKVNAGVSLEKMLSSRFSIGLMFNYTNFKFPENQYNYYYSYPTVKSDVYSIGANAKFFILNEGLFRPFLGVGFNYNWNKLDYDYYNNYGHGHYNNYDYDYDYGHYSNYNYNNYNNYYDQGYTQNYFAGLLTAGTELRFSESLGLNVDFRYIKPFSKQQDFYYPYYYGTSLLETVARGMENADIFAFNFGLLIAF